jgi:type IV pilus assembly protein PilQ
MKKRLTILTTCCLLLLANALQAQSREEQKIKRAAAQGKTSFTQEETVSFNADLPYKKAIESLSVLSKKFLKKPIIDPSPLTTPIGVEIQPMYWKDALELILRTNNLWYAEKDDFIQVAQIAALAAGGESTPAGAVAAVDSGAIISQVPEVIISAIFLEINTSKLRESGLNFNIFRGHDLNLGVEFTGADRVSNNVFGVTVAPSSNKLTVNIDAALRIFESEQVGEILARPQTVVRSGSTGRIQIGTDFSIKQRDFQGNIIDVFQPSGTILQVSAKVYKYGATNFIDLGFHAEKSSVTPGSVTTIKNITTADGRKLVLDGEESYVGGLYSNEEDVSREGIPVLKDLPWWVFGLRYVFGYDKVSVIRKELIILFKAELVPSIDHRLQEMAKDRNVTQEKLKESREDMEKRTKKQQ